MHHFSNGKTEQLFTLSRILFYSNYRLSINFSNAFFFILLTQYTDFIFGCFIRHLHKQTLMNNHLQKLLTIDSTLFSKHI